MYKKIIRFLAIVRRLISNKKVTVTELVESSPIQANKDSHTASAHFKRASELMERCEFSESLQHFSLAIELAPDWHEAYEVYGRCLWICHHYELASTIWLEGRNRQHLLAQQRGLDTEVAVFDYRWTRWLGNCSHIDAYIKLQKLGLLPSKRLKVIVNKTDVANLSYLLCYRDYLTVEIAEESASTASENLALTCEPLHVFYLIEKPVFYYYALGLAQKQWEISGKPALLSLTSLEHARGAQALRSLGIPDTSWYVCLHVRESGFYGEEADLTNITRNAQIDTYLPAIENIINAGGVVIRMGDSTMSPLPRMEGLIDYALSPIKSDWMDIFICATSRFFVGTNSSLYHVCLTFGVPAALSNWIPITSYPISHRDIFTPKLLYLNTEKRLLTFKEMLQLPRDVWSGHLFQKLNISVIDNKPDEILSTVTQMISSIQSVYAYDTFSDSPINGDINHLNIELIANARISSYFVNKHNDIFADHFP